MNITITDHNGNTVPLHEHDIRVLSISKSLRSPTLLRVIEVDDKNNMEVYTTKQTSTNFLIGVE